MPKREKDRASGTGRNDSDKRAGGGSFAWGRADGRDDSAATAVASQDPNSAVGAFAGVLEKRCKHKYLSKKDLANPLFYEGVLLALKARQSAKPVGVWVATTIGLTEGFDAEGGAIKGSSFDKSFRASCSVGDGFANVDGFMTKESIGPSSTGTVFVASESDVVTTTILVEAIVACGCDALAVGVLTKEQLSDVVEAYGSNPWTDKAGFDAAVDGSGLQSNVNPMARNRGGAEESKSGDASAVPAAAASAGKVGMSDEEKEAKRAADDEKIAKSSSALAQRLDKSKYMIYDDDAALGKKAPAIDGLVYKKDGPHKYSDAKFTVLGFWGKFAKGDYTTLNTWSHLQRTYGPKGVQFIGVSRDRKEGDVDKFVSRLGSFMRELGERGITLGANFPLAFDPDTAVGSELQKTSMIMALPVGMAYIVDPSGTILWREQYSRGGSPLNQFERQLDLLTSGESVELVNGNEPDEDEESSDDEEGTIQNIKISAAGEDY